MWSTELIVLLNASLSLSLLESRFYVSCASRNRESQTFNKTVAFAPDGSVEIDDINFDKKLWLSDD